MNECILLWTYPRRAGKTWFTSRFPFVFIPELYKGIR